MTLPPRELLDAMLDKATSLGAGHAVTDSSVLERIDYVCRCISNRAGVRLLMSCMLAKLHRPEVDPRKPYTEIGAQDAFSGRRYDEQFLTKFISDNRLPCNSTTAFLTPALRNHDTMLTRDSVLVGRPPKMYKDTLSLLDDVAHQRASAEHVLTETLRILISIRDDRQARMRGLVESLEHSDDSLPLAAEAIVTLLQQHLACKHSSRLPVLIVAAAYEAASHYMGEVACALKGHLSADQQSGALGDVEICLINEDCVRTVYEMKAKRVTREDIDRALEKIGDCTPRIDNYIFITTEAVENDVREYAAGFYEHTNGTEIALLDCIGFIRHFLHLFHRQRINFLDAYQALVLVEPDSAVKQPLKEAFLTLRHAAESDE